MKLVKRFNPVIMAGLAIAAMISSAGFAHASVVFSGQIDDEQTLSAGELHCPEASEVGFKRTGDFTVSEDGIYAIADAGELVATDVIFAIYQGSFSPANPASKRIAQVDGGALVELEAGSTYKGVITQSCVGQSGVYAFSISGPGTVSGNKAIPVPNWRQGAFKQNSPTANFGNGMSPYAVSESLQVAVTGQYSLADVGVFTAVDVQVLVYQDSFNANDPQANLLTTIDDGGTVLLEEEKDYRVVVTPVVPGSTGDWQIELFPPGSPAINAGIGGTWFNPATPGQGFVIEAYPDTGLLSAAWFTYDLMAAADPGDATLGAAGHRWFLAIGPFSEGDSSSDMNIQLTSGGAFDSSTPEVSQDAKYGEASVEFIDCQNAIFSYDIPSIPVSGTIPLTRIVRDNTSLCAGLTPGPGVISN